MPRGHPGRVKETAKKSKDPKFGNLPGPGPGRPRGVPNRINRDLKEAYLLAANLAGGKEGLVGYLKKQAELENPSAFMTGLSNAPALDAGGKSGRAAHRRARLLHSGGGLKPMPRCADKPVVQ